MIFLKISIIIVSVTMSINILKYIRITLNFKKLICLYWKLLDYPNITYTIILITSFSLNDFKFLILPKIDNISNIKKIIIFNNSTEESITLKIYLQTFLPDNLKDRNTDII